MGTRVETMDTQIERLQAGYANLNRITRNRLSLTSRQGIPGARKAMNDHTPVEINGQQGQWMVFRITFKLNEGLWQTDVIEHNPDDYAWPAA